MLKVIVLIDIKTVLSTVQSTAWHQTFEIQLSYVTQGIERRTKDNNTYPNSANKAHTMGCVGTRRYETNFKICYTRKSFKKLLAPLKTDCSKL